jgi:hypothetical protein
MYKIEILVDLEYDTLCAGCPFYSGGSTDNDNVCTACGKHWESDTCDRPDFCPLEEVKVMSRRN